ncbi:MAG: DMP19 family protein [Verrucomicrobia subdivision 3 bacterium]|nr:DMP19 family protein [Limisphaerales bacterium]
MDDVEKAFEAFTEEFMNRRIYTGLTEEVIRGMPDEHVVQAVLDSIGVRIGRDWEHDVEKVPPLGAGFSAIYFLSILETEVSNGGFNQMFYNNGREAVVHAKEGADLLGLKALASLIGRAWSWSKLSETRWLR